MAKFFSGLWENISQWASNAWENIKGVFSRIGTWIDTNVIQPVSEFFSGLWENFSEWASDAWEDVKDIFSGMGEWFKGILNGIIRLFNKAIDWIFTGINKILLSMKDTEMLGMKPFSGIRAISVPQIPYLAQGAVLPANKPFLAMVGDQKHGTNIEAPLSTIQEAVAIVMEDMVGSQVAGFEAVVSVLREILEAILGIEIDGETLAKAVENYQRKMAVVRGG